MRSMPALPLESRTCKVFDWQYCLSALLIAAACMGIQLECRGQDRPESSEVAESTPSSDTRIRRPVNITPYDVKSTPLYERIKTSINSVRAIDTHDHLRAFDQIPGRVMTAQGHGMTLHSLWSNSYLVRTTRISPWPADGLFDTWWDVAHDDFNDVRATSFYRYLLPAFRDLYGVDFDTVTPLEARKLNERIHANYKTDEWLRKVIVERANIELMFIDPYWSRLQFAREYPFAVPVLNVTTIMRGSHSERFAAANNSPYAYAQRRGLRPPRLLSFWR
jgi:hypothetical protein